MYWIRTNVFYPGRSSYIPNEYYVRTYLFCWYYLHTYLTDNGGGDGMSDIDTYRLKALITAGEKLLREREIINSYADKTFTFTWAEYDMVLTVIIDTLKSYHVRLVK